MNLDGLIYLLNKTGEALADAEQTILALRRQIAESDGGEKPTPPTA